MNTLKKKRFCVSFTETGWLPSTIDLYKAATYPTIIRSADLFQLQLADVFEKNEKKNKTTSVYRLVNV